jgi:hypothetical protein
VVIGLRTDAGDAQPCVDVVEEIVAVVGDEVAN